MIDHFVDAARIEQLQRVVGDVGGAQLVGVGDQDPRHVECDVAVADDDRALAGQVRRHLAEMRVRVVPADKLNRGDTAGQVLARDPQRLVGLRADGVDHRVVALGEFVGLHMLADDEVAEEAEARVAAVFSNCALIDLILGWSGATPERTSPHGVGSISIMSTWMSIGSGASPSLSSDAAAK